MLLRNRASKGDLQLIWDLYHGGLWYYPRLNISTETSVPKLD